MSGLIARVRAFLAWVGAWMPSWRRAPTTGDGSYDPAPALPRADSAADTVVYTRPRSDDWLEHAVTEESTTPAVIVRMHQISKVDAPNTTGKKSVACDCGWACREPTLDQAFEKYDVHVADQVDRFLRQRKAVN